MKTARMSFSNIKDLLSREEMKEIMAGSGSSECGYCSVPGYGNVRCYSGGNSGVPCLCLYRGAGTGC